MRLFTSFLASGFALLCLAAPSRQTGYHVELNTVVGGEGAFDYVYANAEGRQLYIPRMGRDGRITIFNLDTLAPAGEIPQTSGHGCATDSKYHVGFASSNPVAMWDTRTLRLLKTINVDGSPDGILNDSYNHLTYIFSHRAPNATVIDDATGNVLGTIDLGGAPEQAQSDGHGHLFVDIEDQGQVAVVNTNTMRVTGRYSLNGKGTGCAGLALDARNHVLFVACRDPQVMVMLDSRNGNYLADLPIGRGCDGATFNPRTMECLSSQGDGTLTVIKEVNRVKFEVEQTVTTLPGAKTLTLDSRTGRLYLITAQFGPAPLGGRRGPMVPGSFTIVVVGRSSASTGSSGR